MARNADLVLFVVDAQHPEHYVSLKKEIYDVGIRVNQRKPVVKIVKRAKGGLDMSSTVKLSKVSVATLAAVLKNFRIMNADVVIRDNVDIDQFIDSIEGNRKYVKAVTCVSKADLLSPKEKKNLKELLSNPVFVSAEKKRRD